MNLVQQFTEQLADEAARTRRALERVPEGRDDWKPHDRSMPFGRLAMLVARMPSWISFIVDRNELDLSPPGGGSNVDQRPLRNSAELVQAMEEGAAASRKSLAATSEDHLMKPWRLLVSGQVVMEQPRAVAIRDAFGHLAHHRGQLTVYLRMNGVLVPAIYGPSADDTSFA